ncbi:MAG: phosphatase PAP2 family protein [Acidobacteria bacterium]|nr:phosphatase PAP2 family protein [Acidobacteriota bacterium]
MGLLCGALAAPAPAAAQSMPGVRDLFTQAAGDVRRLVSADSAVILSIGGVAAAVGHANDRHTSDAMARSDALKHVFGIGDTVGGARMQAAGALATYTIGRVASNDTVARIGADLIRAQIVTQALTGAVKTAVGRTRPDGMQYSFPSGHAAATFASATVLQRNLGWKVGVPAYAVAAYVATSRVQVRRHFLSDVTFGAALGIAAGRTVTIGRGSRRFALAPTAVPGGGGLTVSWVGNRN